MISNVLKNIFPKENLLIAALAALILGAVAVGFLTGESFLFLAPAVLLLVFLTIVDFRKVFYMLLFFLPFSTEVNLPGGFGTNLPSEPLMVGLMLVYIIYVFKNIRQLSASFLRHPLTLILLLHFGWILFSTITSSNYLVSIKFFLAKTWYIIVFFFLAGSMLQSKKEMKTFLWCVSIPLAISVVYVLFKQSLDGFAFDKVNNAVQPFYRNHVDYASLMVLFFPFIIVLYNQYKKNATISLGLLATMTIITTAIYLSYTRAAYISLLALIPTFFVIRYRLMKIIVGFVIIGASLVTLHFLSGNNYLNYAPNYESTVAHKKFDSLIEATYKGEDVSTMERFYRWIAGVYMIQDKPLSGFGPGNFYNFYQAYTVTSFVTYVSDNPEKSGIHSYYLMLGVEQGLPGIFFFLLLNFYFLLKGEVVYHQTTDPFRKQMVMAVILSVIAIDLLLIINDLIETDKVGTFFFMCLAILINNDLANKKELHSKNIS